MRVAITGSTGLIGSALSPHLTEAGHEAVRVVRRDPTGADIAWSPSDGLIDQNAFEGIDAVVHLAGAGIADHRWTVKYKQELLQSRLQGTALLAKTIAATLNGPRVLLSGSAIGFYGERGDEELNEASSAGSGFLADLCTQWEQATAVAESADIRVTHLRTGIVLSANGGALKKQLPLFKAGLGGKMGNGNQWQSWISIDDEVAAISHLLTADISGPVNLTAPNPVTNAQFTAALGNALHRPTFLPIPRFGPRLLLGRELADNLLFSGQRVLPTKLSADASFTFRHAELAEALESLLAK